MPGQSSLPQVTELDWGDFRRHAILVAAQLQKHKVSLAEEQHKKLHALAEEAMPADRDASASGIQNTLDPLCLVGVTINPESRVKAARGPAKATLAVDRPTLFLLKVHNEAGVTHSLKITSAQLRSGQNQKGWLEISLLEDAASRDRLTGQKLQYVPVLLTAREAGKREATLKFDVGQGTQDLGFRAEVPVLFVVNAKR